MPFFLIDPNWGEPIPVLETQADTAFECLDKSTSPTLGLARLYGNASKFPLPDGKPGNWKLMQSHGFEIKYVSDVELEEAKKAKGQ